MTSAARILCAAVALFVLFPAAHGEPLVTQAPQADNEAAFCPTLTAAIAAARDAAARNEIINDGNSGKETGRRLPGADYCMVGTEIRYMCYWPSTSPINAIDIQRRVARSLAACLKGYTKSEKVDRTFGPWSDFRSGAIRVNTSTGIDKDGAYGGVGLSVHIEAATAKP